MKSSTKPRTQTHTNNQKLNSSAHTHEGMAYRPNKQEQQENKPPFFSEVVVELA